MHAPYYGFTMQLSKISSLAAGTDTRERSGVQRQEEMIPAQPAHVKGPGPNLATFAIDP